MQPIFIAISAILKIGKLNSFKFIKSMTNPFIVLSIPFPKLPARIRDKPYLSIIFNLPLKNIKKIKINDDKILIEDKNTLLPSKILNAAP